MLIVPFFISLGLTPLIKKYSVIAKTYAKENERTIHHGKISRIGGVAIYVSFIISMALFVKADMAVNGMILGGSLMFFAGLIDDLIDMKPLVKLAFEVCAAFILVAFGVGVDVLRLPFGITIDSIALSIVFTIIWIVGITNAVNLIDGLDGLCGGMSVVIFVVIGCIAIVERRMDITIITFFWQPVHLAFWFIMHILPAFSWGIADLCF